MKKEGYDLIVLKRRIVIAVIYVVMMILSAWFSISFPPSGMTSWLAFGIVFIVCTPMWLFVMAIVDRTLEREDYENHKSGVDKPFRPYDPLYPGL